MGYLVCRHCRSSNNQYLRLFVFYQTNKLNDEALLRGIEYINFPSFKEVCEPCYRKLTLEISFIKDEIDRILQIEQQKFDEANLKLQMIELELNKQKNRDQNQDNLLTDNGDEDPIIKRITIDFDIQQRYQQLNDFVCKNQQILQEYQNNDQNQIQCSTLLSFDKLTQDIEQELKDIINKKMNTYLNQIINQVQEDINKTQEDRENLEKIQKTFFESNMQFIESGCLIKEIFLKSFEDNWIVLQNERKKQLYSSALILLESFQNPQS